MPAAIDNIPRVTVADDLDLDSLAKDGRKDSLDEGLVHPAFHFTHPAAPH